jgi:L-ascorbate metabolism protein UlaG (beta-lactamase superfamily)
MRFFETIGSAIVIAYDDRPVLTTDPWINGAAYFGSWGQDYEIPAEQMQAIRDADYHWFSHGHPDHLNVASLPLLTKGEFLLSDHYGNRIKRDLTAAGYRVRVLPDREWIQLSKGIRVYSIANQNQDSLLLIDVNGRLIIIKTTRRNLASASGSVEWRSTSKKFICCSCMAGAERTC